MNADAHGNETEKQALDTIAAIWENAKGTTMGRVEVLDQAAIAALESTLDQDLRQKAEEEAHKLTGSVGTFGFVEGSEIARQIENLLKGDKPLIQEQVLRLSELAVGLREVLESAPTQKVLEQPPLADESGSAAGHDRPLLLMAVADQQLANWLIAEAEARGVRVKAIGNPESLIDAVSLEHPDTVLVDQDLSLGKVPGRTLLRELTAHYPEVLVLLLASQDTFANRLEVARLGTRGFLSRSLLPSQVLDAVFQSFYQPPYVDTRVLAVDSGLRLLGELRELLEPFNISVTGVDDPLRFWDAMEATLPDLLLLDVELPEINGTDLCRVVRNDPRWSRLPVVFLSATTDAKVIEEAFAVGGDDFVSKSTLGKDLAARITNRLSRTATRRYAAETGYSSGVASRRGSAESLVQLVRLAGTHRASLLLAVLDIDNLRRVNERCGRVTGDLVLRRFGDLLHGMLHDYDQAGRWGGGEFVVGMYATTLEAGMRRLSELQAALGKEEFIGANGFSIEVSFSAGVARYPEDGRDFRSLYQAAREALRRSKLGGRILPTLNVPAPEAEAGDLGETEVNRRPGEQVQAVGLGPEQDPDVQMTGPVPETVAGMTIDGESTGSSAVRQDKTQRVPMVSSVSRNPDSSPAVVEMKTSEAGEITDVVIVDDDEVLTALLIHSLENRGYRCASLQDGQAAIDALTGPKSSMNARVVLLDVGLPGVDGLSVLRTLARNGVTQRTKVIMLTVRSAEAEVLNALELGAFDHVAKPFSLSVLMQKIRGALEGRTRAL